MKYSFIILATLIFMGTDTHGQTRYLYAQLDTNNFYQYEYEFGEIDVETGNRYNQLPFENQHEVVFLLKINEILKSLPEHKRNILFYVHGMMGHQDFYLSMVTNTMDSGLYKRPDNKYGLVINLIWRHGWNYGKNITQSLKMGESFAELSRKIKFNSSKINPDVEVSILCHSMGNRLFQGMLNDFQDSRSPRPFYKDVILAAADLESNILIEGQAMYNIGEFAEDVHVYYHEYDRTLMMSQLLNQNERMGLNGVNGMDSIASNIWVIDASYLEDQESLPGKYSNHRYFFASPLMREDIFNLLHNSNGTKLPNRKELDHPQKFALVRE